MGRAREGIGYSLSRLIYSKKRTFLKFSFLILKVSTLCRHLEGSPAVFTAGDHFVLLSYQLCIGVERPYWSKV